MSVVGRPVFFCRFVLFRVRRSAICLSLAAALFCLPLLCLPVLCLLVAVPPLSAETTARPAPATTASLAGTVADPTGAVIPQAAIVVACPGAPPVSATSDGQGNFSIPGLAPGACTVQASAPGFRPARRTGVLLDAGHTHRLQLILAIEIQQQQVTVNASQADSSPENNGGALVIKGADLDALPDDPDDLQTELQAIAGADPNAGSQFYIDGFSGGRLPPKSAIREIRMNQNPYSAQYDAIGWGRIEIFTKPGSDKWHADVWMQGNDSDFNSRNPFVTTQPPYHSWELWTDVNGPVTKNSSQFTDLWYQTSSDDSIVNAFILSSSLQQEPFTQVFPTTGKNINYSTRYDIQVGKIQTLSLRYSYNLNNQTNSGVGQFSLASQAYNVNNTEQVLQFSDTQTYGAKLLNETRFQYIRDRDNQTPQTPGPTIVVQGGFTGGGSNLGYNSDKQDHYELQDYVQTSRGQHTIDFGGRLRALRDSSDTTSNFNGQYTFASLTAYQITQQGLQNGWTPAQISAAGGGPSLFSQTTGQPALAVSLIDLGVYAEDNWKAFRGATLSYGLRFETQNDIPDHADFAPRFGANWAISRGKNKPPIAVLRSGFGLFYQRFPSGNVLTADRQNGIREQTQVVNDPSFYPAVCSSDPGACSGASTLAPTIFRISPSLHAPYTLMAGFGIDKPLGKLGMVSANYQYSRGDHLFLTRNINAPLPGTYNPADPTSGTRPLGTDQNIYEYDSEGASVMNRLVVNSNIHAHGLGIFAYYMLGKNQADTSGISSFPSSQYDLHQDWGRSSSDTRNRAVFGGFWDIWRGFSVNPFLLYSSSAPFNIVVGQDLNGDTQFNDRPAFATDFSRSTVVRTQWGVFDTQPIAGEKIIPINYGKGPDTFVLNMRLSKNFSFGPALPRQETPAPAAKGAKNARPAKKTPIERKYNLGLSINSSNVLNHVNLAAPVGVLGSPLFGQSTALSGTFGSGSANRNVNLDLFFRF